MQLMLSDEEARTLRNVIHDHLPDMRRQEAATDIASRELKHELRARVQVCERLLSQLDAGSGSAGSAMR